MNRMNGRYPLGISMARPYNHISETTLENVVDLLQKTRIAPNDCLSKGQLKEQLQLAVAQTFILERRQTILNDRLVAFRNQCNQLPEDDPIRITFGKFLEALVEGMDRG